MLLRKIFLWFCIKVSCEKFLFSLFLKIDRRLSDPEATTDTLKGHLRTVLSSCRHKGKKMLLVFDGLNEVRASKFVFAPCV